MGFGVGVFLLLVGAILAFAVRDSWEVLDVTMIGYICIGVGILALILALVTLLTRPAAALRCDAHTGTQGTHR
jgi:hypothetical protein